VSTSKWRRPPDWNLPLARPLRPVFRTRAIVLTTLHDAAAFVLELPERERTESAWIEVAGTLLTAATTKRSADVSAATDRVEASLRANGYLLGPKLGRVARRGAKRPVSRHRKD
jgi:hypothetical protein